MPGFRFDRRENAREWQEKTKDFGSVSCDANSETGIGIIVFGLEGFPLAERLLYRLFGIGSDEPNAVTVSFTGLPRRVTAWSRAGTVPADVCRRLP